MIDAKLVRDMVGAIRESSKSTEPYDTTAEVVRVEGDTIWVHIPGGVDETPVAMSVSAGVGDSVRVRVSGGQAWITGNDTAPPTDDATAIIAKTTAQTAQRTAVQALDDAQLAQSAAEQAEASAVQANAAASQAVADAETAKTAAGNAQTSADAAAVAAQEADRKAVAAGTAADTAKSAADSAVADATLAKSQAVEAVTSANEAKASATQANTYATAALDQLGIVEDVVGVLNWATEHGTFAKTTDTAVAEGKVYFTYDSTTGDYTPVISPQAADLSSYYELSEVKEAMRDFIMAHLAVTSRGLWVLPKGFGTASDAQYAPDYKALLSNDGMYVYDGNGVMVSKYGESIEFNSTRPQRIGGTDAYIEYHDSNGDGKADSLRIVGAKITIGGTQKTVEDAFEDVDTLISAARDVADGAQSSADALEESLNSFSESTNEALDSLNTELHGDGTESNTGIAGLLDLTRSDVSELSTDFLTLADDIHGFMKFGTSEGHPVLTLGSDESDFKMNLTNEEIQFLYKGVVLAYLTGNALRVNDLLSFGNFVVYQRDNGHFTIKYVGSGGNV